MTHDSHVVVVCLLCGQRKATLTSPHEQTLLTFECKACGFAWSSLNPLRPDTTDQPASAGD